MTTVTQYVPNTTDYLVSYPAEIEVHAGSTAQGTLLAESLFYYDGATSSSVPPVNGDMTRSDDWLNQPNSWLSSTAQYDTYGNKIASTDPMGNRSAWVYDTTYHIFVTQAQDPLYATDDPSQDQHDLGHRLRPAVPDPGHEWAQHHLQL